MLKITVLFIASFAFSSIITAQQKKVSYGVIGGLNISNQKVDNTFKNEYLDSKLGFHVGGFTEISLSKSFSLQPEILFSNQGSIEDNNSIKYTLSENYIKIPLLLNYYIVDNLKIQAGPQIGFLLSVNRKTEVDPNYFNFQTNDLVLEKLETTQDVAESYEVLNFGLNFGAGYELSSGILFNIRYNLGLSDIIKNDNSEVKNSVFQVSLGYKF